MSGGKGDSVGKVSGSACQGEQDRVGRDRIRLVGVRRFGELGGG